MRTFSLGVQLCHVLPARHVFTLLGNALPRIEENRYSTVMTTRLKWGLIGTGGIARRFAAGLLESRTGELVAIGSRSESSASAFARDFPAACHASYEALLADPNVEAVYISTPHPFHAHWAIKAADAGKHILCEKPMTMNHAEALAVIEAARRNDVFLMEAFMYRCHPQTARILELLRDKAIGEVKFVHATFSFEARFGLEHRLFNRALGGGGILDVGGYCASMARFIAGAASGSAFEDPIEVKGVAHIGEQSRVDEYAIASMKFPNGVLAQLTAGVRLNLESNVRVVGSEGSLLIPAPWSPVPGGTAGFAKIIIFKEGVPREIVIEADRGIYAIEADHVAEHLAARQSPAMSWADTLGNMKTLDAWCGSVGLAYDL
jgi:predicted dehydrogenase